MEEDNFSKQFELDWPVNCIVADEKMLCLGISNKHFQAVMCDVDTGPVPGTDVWNIQCQDIPQYMLSYADTAEGMKLDMWWLLQQDAALLKCGTGAKRKTSTF